MEFAHGLCWWAWAIASIAIRYASAQPGFLSLDCGGNSTYTDSSTGIRWQPDQAFISTGANSSVIHQIPNSSLAAPYRNLRSFSDSVTAKFCYSLPVNSGQRYLVRATFLYGNYDGRNTAPQFRIFINLTQWSDVEIRNSDQDVFHEMLLLSTGRQLDVCLVRGTAGVPFISTLELRQLIGSMYSVPYETLAYLKHIVRINFGALTADDIRYPDDPVDRRWQSDLTRPNNLAREAPGTVRVSTNRGITVATAADRPPEKVMQTAVVGSSGNITYRYLINEFPAFAYAKTYFAEIQELNTTDVRAFTFILPNDTLFPGQVVNLKSDVGAFNAYEPGFDNVSLRSIINFSFQKTADANLGPILNAMEILKIVNQQPLTNSDDVKALNEFVQQFQLAGAGDPCNPVAWDWLRCSTDSSPRIVGISLSARKLSGSIPTGITKITSLTAIDLSNNSLSGTIPDLSRLSALRQLHLENNRLSGDFPASLAAIASLQELYVANNFLTGKVPAALVSKRGLDFQYSGNPDLCLSDCSSSSTSGKVAALVGGLLGGVVLCLIALVASWFFWFRRKKTFKPHKSNQESFTSMISKYHSNASDTGSVVQEQQSSDEYRYTYQELKEASNNFRNEIGSGGFGTVYYGRLKNGAEVAIKVLSAQSHQGTREFCNEVTLLSRIHHRNLVSFLGYCNEGKERILVYEFMHVGTLRDCLYAKADREHLNWITRLSVLLDAARGLDYLHTGCNPTIIHRDVKSSNILIGDKRVGKVADFGLSKMTSEESSLASTTVKGTVGYLDPEYYMNQRLTEKSDVYSFGIVLLETISAREPLKPELFKPESNIVQWARVALQKGNIESIVDPALSGSYRMDSMWKAAETAMYCVEPYGINRPTMNEVIRELEEACQLEQGSDTSGEDINQHYPRGYHLDGPRNPLQTTLDL